MKLEEKLLVELDKLNRKVDRMNSILQHLPTNHQTHLEDWLDERQTQELLNRKTTSLWGLRKQGKIVFTHMNGAIYYSRQSILDYLEANRSDKGRKTFATKYLAK